MRKHGIDSHNEETMGKTLTCFEIPKKTPLGPWKGLECCDFSEEVWEKS
jgi:hypothetical protein